MANQVWSLFLDSSTGLSFQQAPFLEWIRVNLSFIRHFFDDFAWADRFAIVLWWLWKWRCNRIFRFESIPLSVKTNCLDQFLNEVKNAISVQKSLFPTSIKHNTLVSWSPPRDRFVVS